MTWQLALDSEVTFAVDMEPVGKARPRFTRNGRVYTPAETTKAEKRIKSAYLCQVGMPKLWDDEVEVIICYHRQAPKATSMAKDCYADLSKPDVDNVAKLVLDALNGCAWVDDAQVTKLKVLKGRRTKFRASGIEVTIRFFRNRLEDEC